MRKLITLAGWMNDRHAMRRVFDELPDEKPDYMSVDEWLLTRAVAMLVWLRHILRRAVWLAVVFFVLIVGLEIQTSKANHNTDKAQRTAHEAKDAAHAAKVAADQAKVAAQRASTDLANALAQARSNPNSPDAVRSALESIARIEQHLCGGPCPSR